MFFFKIQNYDYMVGKELWSADWGNVWAQFSVNIGRNEFRVNSIEKGCKRVASTKILEEMME